MNYPLPLLLFEGLDLVLQLQEHLLASSELIGSELTAALFRLQAIQ